MDLIFATNNQHKLQEVRQILKEFNIVSLFDLGIISDIPEDHDTLEQNALQKARFIFGLTDMNVIADDTGLEIDALNGRPGVFSARYAGEGCSFTDNVKKVLGEMDGISNRKAAFRTVVALILNGKEYLFEGNVHGSIIHEHRGNEGFGYDPVFIPEGYDKTFAEMTADLKNKLSHRAVAFKKVADFFKENELKY
jgi:XTP/dITP diphosphohydrolase